LYYGGRREGGKGWDWLLEAFAAAVTRHRLPFDLVTTGVGPVNPPPSIADRVIDLGFLDRQEIADVFAAADAYVQPSRMESFSFTIMEAWLAGTPVVANGESDVVTWHCERSGAGLTYHDWYEFAECLRFLAEAPEAARKLAAPGRDYVVEHYSWDPVLDTMEARLEEMP
ncbi:MAG: glycosyltransferase family 4 protein, partial [Actinomycetota bacterium]